MKILSATEYIKPAKCNRCYLSADFHFEHEGRRERTRRCWGQYGVAQGLLVFQYQPSLAVPIPGAVCLTVQWCLLGELTVHELTSTLKRLRLSSHTNSVLFCFVCFFHIPVTGYLSGRRHFRRERFKLFFGSKLLLACAAKERCN